MLALSCPWGLQREQAQPHCLPACMSPAFTSYETALLDVPLTSLHAFFQGEASAALDMLGGATRVQGVARTVHHATEFGHPVQQHRIGVVQISCEKRDNCWIR